MKTEPRKGGFEDLSIKKRVLILKKSCLKKKEKKKEKQHMEQKFSVAKK